MLKIIEKKRRHWSLRLFKGYFAPLQKLIYENLITYV